MENGREGKARGRESRGNSMRDLSEKSGIWVSKIFFFFGSSHIVCESYYQNGRDGEEG